MNITINKTSDCEAQVTATVPADVVSEKKNRILAAITRSVRVPGFRPGKTPTSVVAKRYAEELQAELEQDLSQDLQNEVATQHAELAVIEYSEINCEKQDDGSYTLSTTATVIPEFELPEYKGLEVTLPAVNVTDEDVDKALQNVADARAEFEPVERAAAKGDMLKLDFTTEVEGQKPSDFCGEPVGLMDGREGYILSTADNAFIPGWADGLIGVAAGETKDLVLTMPEDFVYDKLAGKEMTFHCTVIEVQERRVPEVNEELFAEMLPGKNMDEIRSIVRENLQHRKEQENEEAKADQVTEQLADKLSYALPQKMIDTENNNTVRRKMQEALQKGEYAALKDVDAFRQNCLPETERNLRVYFALQKIAGIEHVTATDDELIRAVAALAEQEGEKNLRKYIQKLQRANRLTGIRMSIVTSKVLDLLVRNAKVTYTGAEEAPAAAEVPTEAPAEQA